MKVVFITTHTCSEHALESFVFSPWRALLAAYIFLLCDCKCYYISVNAVVSVSVSVLVWLYQCYSVSDSSQC